MLKRSLLLAALATSLSLAAAYAQQPVQPVIRQGVPAQPAAQAQPAQVPDSLAIAMLQIEYKKAQLQVALAGKVTQNRDMKLKQLQSQQAVGQASESAVSDAELEATQAHANEEISKINLQILDVQIKNPPMTTTQPQPPATPTEVTIMSLEMKKSQIDAGTADRAAQIRQRQLREIQSQAQVGRAGPAQLADAQMDADAAQTAADIAKLDLEAIQTRLTALTSNPPRR